MKFIKQSEVIDLTDFNTVIKEDPDGARKRIRDFTDDDLLILPDRWHGRPIRIPECCC